MKTGGPVVVVVAGRRMDAADAEVERFPSRNLTHVRRAIHDALAALPALLLVSSAACGTDLLALQAAGALGIRRRIVLPFPIEHFREVSVVDRPGDWGPLFDSVIADVSAAGDVIVLNSEDEVTAFAETNDRILAEGDRAAASAQAPRVALVAWEGSPRGDDDLTAHFRASAVSHGWSVTEIATR